MRRKIARAFLVGGLVLIPVESASAACSWTTLTNGTTADATQVMGNFDCLAPLASPVFSGNVGMGTATAAAFPLEIFKAQNAATLISVANSDTGSGASVGYQIDNGTAHGSLMELGSGWAGGGSSINKPNGTKLEAAGSGGLTLTTSTAQPIYFGINSTEVARFATDGSLAIGTSTPSSKFTLVGATPATSYTAGNGSAYFSQLLSAETLSQTSGTFYTNILLDTKSDSALTTSASAGITSVISDSSTVSQPSMISGYFTGQHLGSASTTWLTGVFSVASNSSATTVTNVTALRGATSNSVTGATITNARGVQGTVSNSVATGTMAAASGLYSQITNGNSTANITTASGLMVDALVNTGTITNTYGVYVGTVTAGTQTNPPYSFYAADTSAYNYFGGFVGIGISTPTAPLQIGGSFTTSSAIGYGIRMSANLNGGASTNQVRGIDSSPAITSGSNNPAFYSVVATVRTGSGFTGQVGGAYNFYGNDNSFAGSSQYATNMTGLYQVGITNGSGITSGMVTNYGVRVRAHTAGAGSGGTVVNYGENIEVPTGFGAGTTTNYGLRITGAGGSVGAGSTTNYSIYSDSSAKSYFAGNVGVGTSTPGQPLDVVGTIRQSGCTTAGTLSANASGDIICTSDARLKNVHGAYNGGLKVLERIQPERFTYKPTKSNPIETFVHVGFIAQNVRKSLPEATALQRDGYYSLDTTAVLAAAVNAIKELKADNDRQATEIGLLKRQVADLTRLSSGRRQASLPSRKKSSIRLSAR